MVSFMATTDALLQDVILIEDGRNQGKYEKKNKNIVKIEILMIYLSCNFKTKKETSSNCACVV